MSSSHLDRTAEAEIALAEFLAQQVRNATTYFGYPEVPENNDLSILGISSLAKLHLNNAGDPWVHGNAKMHTKDFEREVLAFVADIYGTTSDYWGYVTSGGTEGNLYGMYASREYFKSQDKTPILLYTASSHYSIPKNSHLLGLKCYEVASQSSGEMDYHDLEKQLWYLKERHQNFGLIINLNIGTTMTGAVDDISKINELLASSYLDRSQYLLHADAALMGFIYPFTQAYQPLFELGVTSIAISGHKFPGAIHPCGIVLTKKSFYDKAFSDNWVPYVGSRDTTISGSRNGFLALNLWYIFKKKGKEGLQKEASTCIANARYLKEKLIDMNYPEVHQFPEQNIVTFQLPNETIVKKYQLATQGSTAHIVVMQHITKERIDRFCDELRNSL